MNTKQTDKKPAAESNVDCSAMLKCINNCDLV